MKTALITGVSRGIGRALSEKFLDEKYFVIGTSKNGKIDYEDRNLKVFELDLSKPESIKKCAIEINAQSEKIDVLINNAGVLLDDDETHVMIDLLRGTLEVNLIGTIDFTERILAKINDAGHIINISSQAGSLKEMDHILESHYPYHYPAYKISKCAINMYTRTLAAQLRHEGLGITVSSVHPGWVRTEMGGEEAPTLPGEAAEQIFKLATSKIETGQFWYNGKKYPW